MKRDMDLVRKILMLMSENEQGPNIKWTELLPDYTKEQIYHHAHLMAQGDLIDAADASTLSDRLPMAIPTSITWRGHEFIDSLRDPSLWAAAKKNVIGPGGAVAFTVLLEWAKAEALRRLGGA